MKKIPVNGHVLEVPDDEQILTTINKARAALGMDALPELPKAVPQEPCGCVFGKALGITVMYEHLDVERWWESAAGAVFTLPIHTTSYDVGAFAAAVDGEVVSLPDSPWKVRVDGQTPWVKWMLAFDHWQFTDLLDGELCDVPDHPLSPDELRQQDADTALDLFATSDG